MSTTEQRLKETFDAIVLPDGLKGDTLRVIEHKRMEMEAGTENGSSVTTTAMNPSDTGRSRRTPMRVLRRSSFAIAACLILVALGIGGFAVYVTETAYVEIEVNPSIVLGLNRFDIVVGAWANNADGQDVLGDISIIGRSYSESLSLITESKVFLSFIDDYAFMDISVISSDERQSDELAQYSQLRLDSFPFGGRCNQVSEDERKAARDANMGIARFEAAQELMALDSTVSIEDCRQMSMRELRQRITAIDPNNDFSWHGGANQGISGYGGGQGGRA